MPAIRAIVSIGVLMCSIGVFAGEDAVSNFFPPVIQGNPRAIAIDEAGNRYVAGFHFESADFNPGIGLDWKTVEDGSVVGGFVTRFNRDGSYAWTHSTGNALISRCNLVVVSDRLYACGESGEVAFVLALKTVDGTPLSNFASNGVLDLPQKNVHHFAASGEALYVSLRSHSAVSECEVMAFNLETGQPVEGFGTLGVQTIAASEHILPTGLAFSGGVLYASGRFAGAFVSGGTGAIGAAGFHDGYVMAMDAATGAPKLDFGIGGVQVFSGSGADTCEWICVSENRIFVTGNTGSSDAGIGGTGSFDAWDFGSNVVIALDRTTGLPLDQFGSHGIQRVDQFLAYSLTGIAATRDAVYVSDNFSVSISDADAGVFALDASTGAPISSFGAGGLQSFGGGWSDSVWGIAVSKDGIFITGTLSSFDAGIGGSGNIDGTGFGGFLVALDEFGNVITQFPDIDSDRIVETVYAAASLGSPLNFIITLTSGKMVSSAATAEAPALADFNISFDVATQTLSSPAVALAGMATIQLRDGHGSLLANLVLTVSRPTNSNTPHINSAPTATPNPALVGKAIEFSISATDTDGDVLSYYWDFGDGTSSRKRVTTHSYAAAGMYVVTANVSDGKNDAYRKVNVFVVDSAQVTSDISSFKLAFDFRKAEKSSLIASGKIRLAANQNPSGMTVNVNIPGTEYSQDFFLNTKGIGGDQFSQFTLKVSAPGAATSIAKFTLHLKGVNASGAKLFDQLAPLGYVNSTVGSPGRPVTLPLTIQAPKNSGALQLISIKTNYRAVQFKSAKAVLEKRR